MAALLRKKSVVAGIEVIAFIAVIKDQFTFLVLYNERVGIN